MTRKAAFSANGSVLPQDSPWLAALTLAPLTFFLVGSLFISRRKPSKETGSQAQLPLLQELITQSERLNRTLTIEQVLSTIGSGSQGLSMADGAAVFYRSQEQPLALAWSQFTEFAPQANFLPLIEQYLAHLPEWTADPILVVNVEHESKRAQLRGALRLGKFKAFAAWPLVYAEKTSAYACVFYLSPANLSKERTDILVAFLRQAAVSLENARLFEAECAQRRLSDALRDVSGTLNSTLDLDEVLEGILNSLEHVVPHDAAGIMTIDGDMLKPARWHGIPKSSAEKFQSWQYPLKDLDNRQQMLKTIHALVISDTEHAGNWIKTAGMGWVRSYAGAPICQRGQITGFIDVMSACPGFFQPETGAILQSFANQAAIALENARLYQDAQQRMAETSALYRAIQPLFNPAEDILALSQQITQSVTEEFSSAHCEILLINEARTHLTLVAQSGSLVLDATELPLNGLGLTVAAALSGQVIYAPDVRTDPDYLPGSARTRSELAIPMQAGGQIIGVMNLENPEVDAFDERERRILISFAERAALGLENARLFSTVRQNALQMADLHAVAQRKAQELEALHTATTSLVSTLDLQNLLERILAAAASAVQASQAAALHLLENHHLELRVQQGIPDDQLRSYEWNDDDGPWRWAVRNRHPVLISAGHTSPARFDKFPPGACWAGHSLLIAPLVLDEKCLGVISLIAPTPDAFDEQSLRLLISFASTATAAIHNAQLHSEVRYLAVTDPLTGIYNRRGFFERARQQVELANRTGQPVSAVMIDIDFFKRINDRYGHDAGDAVLSELASRCRASLRDSDLICRYGGEEFAILLPGCNGETALATARRLFHDITGHPMQTPSGPVDVTISVGVAAECTGSRTVGHLLTCADQALYAAKDAGRNRVSVWNR